MRLSVLIYLRLNGTKFGCCSFPVFPPLLITWPPACVYTSAAQTLSLFSIYMSSFLPVLSQVVFFFHMLFLFFLLEQQLIFPVHCLCFKLHLWAARHRVQSSFQTNSSLYVKNLVNKFLLIRGVLLVNHQTLSGNSLKTNAAFQFWIDKIIIRN